jgi:hypothetical protein
MGKKKSKEGEKAEIIEFLKQQINKRVLSVNIKI